MTDCSSPHAAPYAGRQVALATRHGKERVIARPLRHGLGATVLHLEAIDTDRLGSFCGTVERRGDARQACVTKARLALEHGGCGLAIASEGSFGPHPAVPLLAVGLECMVFLDADRDLRIEEELLARRTNFSHRLLEPPDGNGEPVDPGLESWLGQVGFPSHALLVRPHHADAPEPVLAKGIHDRETLDCAIRQAAEQAVDGRVRLETDMRAHCNPTRMASIRQLSFRLVRRIASPCPSCGSPGWGRIGLEPGLPCDWCGQPTRLIRWELLGCPRCDHRRKQPGTGGPERADPAHCDQCNP